MIDVPLTLFIISTKQSESVSVAELFSLFESNS